MTWPHIPKEEARMMESVWTRENFRNPRQAPSPLSDSKGSEEAAQTFEPEEDDDLTYYDMWGMRPPFED